MDETPDLPSSPANAGRVTELIAPIAAGFGLLLLFLYFVQGLSVGEFDRSFSPATATVREAGWACADGDSWERWCPKRQVDARNAGAPEDAPFPRGGYFIRFGYTAEGGTYTGLWPAHRAGLTPETAHKGATFDVLYDPEVPGRVTPPQPDAEPGTGLMIAGLFCLVLGVAVFVRNATRRTESGPALSVPEPLDYRANPDLRAGLTPPERFGATNSTPAFGKRKPGSLNG